jgi:hypothetical protein
MTTRVRLPIGVTMSKSVALTEDPARVCVSGADGNVSNEAQAEKKVASQG